MSTTRNKIIKEAAQRALVKEAAKGGFVNKVKDFGRRASEKVRFSSKGAQGAGKAPKDAEQASMNLPKLVGTLVAAIGINQFVGQMITLAKKKKVEMEEPKYYEKMLKANPKLMEEDPEKVIELWSTLHHHSTHLAKDPVAAGAFITQSLQGRVREELGGPTIDTYSTLNKIEGDAVSNDEKKYNSGQSLTETLLTGMGIAS